MAILETRFLNLPIILSDSWATLSWLRTYCLILSLANLEVCKLLKHYLRPQKFLYRILDLSYPNVTKPNLTHCNLT